MDEQVSATGEEQVRGEVASLLEKLGKSGNLDVLRSLFIDTLGYTYENASLSPRPWPKTAKDLLEEDPTLFAIGANHDFHIIYVRLQSHHLPLGEERLIVTQLLKQHLDALFVFSNQAQTMWHFLNVKPDSEKARRRLFRRITVGPGERLRTASERLSMLALSDEKVSRLAIVALHENAFDVEAVTKHFFNEYKVLFQMVQTDLRQQTGDAVWAHDYALQLLNRCMFLYFIQRKGWLGNDKEFLRTFWHSYRNSRQEQDTFFEKWLSVLFLEAFNKKFNAGHRHFPAHIHSILAQAPYLNGGLFSPNKLDLAGHTFTITDERFQQTFLFFERFNFTISEDSPLDQEVAVDPEMIGKVYESLVNVSTEIDERGDAGIFYTPRTEIDLMCRLALVDYLANALGQEHKPVLYDAVFALEQEEKSSADDALTVVGLWDRVADLLPTLKIVDPACGSGSFLVGMLYVLDDLQARANTYRYVDENAYRRKKRIIGESLYGVDVMEWAVHIAELRLWLTLIVDAGFEHLAELYARHDPLLPHLSFKVRVGDSIVQEVGGITMGHLHTTHTLPPALKRQLNKLKEDKLNFYHNYESRHPKPKAQLEQDELNFFRAVLDERIHTLEQEQKKARRGPEASQESFLDENTMRSHDYAAERERRAAAFDEDIERAKKARAALIHPKNVPFIWDIAFVEVFADGRQGFDIIIGNPPYVRQEEIADPYLPREEAKQKENKARYKAKLTRTVYQAFPDFFGYKEARDSATHKLDAKSDLYIYFYFYGLRLLHSQGTFCFITSNSWLDVGYGADLQEFLLRYCQVKMIIDNQEKRSFASAAVNTIIALFSSPQQKPSQATLTATARFVLFTVTFEHILSAETFRQIEKTGERTTTTEYRLHPVQQQALLQEGIASPEAEESAEEKSTHGKKPQPLVNEAQEVYTGDKWGGKYLRAPDIYWTILQKGKGKLVRLGDIADMRFGIKTGANEFFYLDEAKIRQWKIEPEFLHSAIKSPRESKSILIEPERLSLKLLLCHKERSELKGTAVLEYIKWGESRGFHRGPSCANRARWWDVGIRRSPYLGFNYLIDSTARTFYAYDGCYFSDNFQEVNIPEQQAVSMCLSLNSTVFQLMVNVAGRANFGDGLLKIQTYEVSDLFCVHPHQIHFEDISVFSSTSWDVLLPSTDRRTLDSMVFDALNLTQGERDGVYEAVITLVEKRLQKAGSLDGRREREPKEQRKKREEAFANTLGIWTGLPDEEEEVDNTYA